MLIENPVLEVESTSHHGRMATRSGQSVPEANKLTYVDNQVRYIHGY